ncbi:hypothetical protein LINGRAHAP2_LOCUS4801, partial [Linum grandiflorum]
LRAFGEGRSRSSRADEGRKHRPPVLTKEKEAAPGKENEEEERFGEPCLVERTSSSMRKKKTEADKEGNNSRRRVEEITHGGGGVSRVLRQVLMRRRNSNGRRVDSGGFSVETGHSKLIGGRRRSSPESRYGRRSLAGGEGFAGEEGWPFCNVGKLSDPSGYLS